MNASAGAPAADSKGGLLRRWWFWAALLALLLVGAYALVKTGKTGKQAEIAAGYMAHVVCSCRYVGNRDMASCDTDREPGMDIVQVKDDPAARSVTARVPLLASRTAKYDPEYGCALDRP